MFRPHVAGGMFFKSGSSFWRYELQGLLSIRCNADTSANLTESGRSLVDLDVNVRVFEQGDSSAEAPDASAEDRNSEGLGGGSSGRHISAER